jgi:organic hydroperoxide reductase OsmC/OhrA
MINDIHTYETNLVWNVDRNATLSATDINATIEVTTPPAFPKGVKGIWTPEHLFVAALNSCIMSTFLLIAENSQLAFISFSCNAIGTASKVDGKYLFTEVLLKPIIKISSETHIDKVKRVLELSEKACTISNSINTKIIVAETISVI